MTRSLEVSIALVAALLSFPLFCLAALALRADLGRPLLFRQTRSGLHGRPFELVKLRTMTMARDSAGQPLPDSERQTPVTRLVRRLRLDELLQLRLVLGGQMALVGPRPLLPATIAGFGEAGRRRGRVRPGLTGWSQVSGNTLLSDEEKLALDLWYIENRSTALDLRILFETGFVALRGEKRHPERLALAGLPEEVTSPRAAGVPAP